jgi:hypothetical protein
MLIIGNMNLGFMFLLIQICYRITDYLLFNNNLTIFLLIISD